jgi:hypothetical protein
LIATFSAFSTRDPNQHGDRPAFDEPSNESSGSWTTMVEIHYNNNNNNNNNKHGSMTLPLFVIPVHSPADTGNGLFLLQHCTNLYRSRGRERLQRHDHHLSVSGFPEILRRVAIGDFIELLLCLLAGESRFGTGQVRNRKGERFRVFRYQSDLAITFPHGFWVRNRELWDKVLIDPYCLQRKALFL